VKKTGIIIGLLLIIALSLGFVALKSQARGSDDNFFNRELRQSFAENTWLRRVLELHYDGDAQSDYLGKRYTSILIEVDSLDTQTIRLEALNNLVKKIQEITGKETSYLVSDRNIIDRREIGERDIEEITARYRHHFNHGDTATVYLLMASVDAQDADKLGTTFRDYGVVLFAKALDEVTRDNPDTLSNYELSTALHEFGHQLGLPHNEQPGCLMNEQVELKRDERPADVVVDFCDYEKVLIKEFIQ